MTKEENERLCRVGRGTPAGELFRSVWLPAVRSSQIPEPRSAPVRLKLLGEELVAFRDGSGKPGIVQAKCAHRRAPLFFGRVEERGLRCSYHGWVFDRDGQCIDIPSVPNKDVWNKMQIRSYRVEEKADIVWIFMGEGEPPALPKFPWIDLPQSRRIASVWLQEANWLQGVEGEIDTAHIAVLHKTNKSATRAHRHYTFKDPSPVLSAHDTKIGFMSVARRNADDKYYWRVTQWMAPMFSFVPSADWPIGGRAWVPVDDYNTYTWDFTYSASDLQPEFFDVFKRGAAFPPEIAYQPVKLNTGAIVDTWRPVRNRDNDYLVDRSLQGASHTTGILGINDQDRAVQEGMDPITDRSEERLVASDRTVVEARRRLLAIIESQETIQRFRDLVRDGTAYAVEPLDVVSPTADAAAFLAEARLV